MKGLKMKKTIYNFRKYLFALRKFKRYTSLIFDDYAIYLKPGKYKYDYNFAYYYLENYNQENYPARIFAKNRKMKGTNSINNLVLKSSYFLIALFTKKRVKNNSLNISNYQAELVFNKRGPGLKLFDNENKKVINILSNIDGLKTIKEIKLVYEYFNTPIVDIHKDGKIIIEEWVVETSRESLSKDDVLEMSFEFLSQLNRFLVAYDLSSVTKVNSKKILSKFDSLLKDIPDPILKKLEHLNYDFPVINFFSDIGGHNVLIQNRKYKIIDYDGFRNIFPMTIAIKFLSSFSSGTSFNTIYHFKKGTFDSCFEELFKNLNLRYEPNLKKEYFIYSHLIELYILRKQFNFNQLKLNQLKDNFHKTLEDYSLVKII